MRSDESLHHPAPSRRETNPWGSWCCNPIRQSQGCRLGILGSAVGSALKGAPGGAPESAQGDWNAPGSAPESAPCGASTRRALPGAPPNLPEHSREHPPHFPEDLREHFPEQIPKDFPISTPVTGGWDCNSVVLVSVSVGCLVGCFRARPRLGSVSSCTTCSFTIAVPLFSLSNPMKRWISSVIWGLKGLSPLMELQALN